MQERKENRHSLRPFFNSPFFDEDFWGIEIPSQTGLSLFEDNEFVYVEAHLPGLKAEDIELSFDNGVLWVKGEKKEEEEDKAKKYYKKASSSFSYRVQVPGEVDEKKEPEANYKDGVLKVKFVKATKSQAKKIRIKS